MGIPPLGETLQVAQLPPEMPPGLPGPLDPMIGQMEPELPPDNPVDPVMQEMIDRLDHILSQTEEDGEEDLGEGPIYPYWYDEDDYPEPDQGQIEQVLEWEKERHQEWAARVQEDLLRYFGKITGVFKDFNEDAEETFRSTTMTNEVNLGANYIATIPPVYKPVWINPEDRDEASRKAALLDAIRRGAVRQHSRAGNGLLARDEAFMLLVFGCVCSLNLLNLDDPDYPIRHRLINPLGAFPQFADDRGLARMILNYSTTIGKLNGALGGKEGKVLSQLKAKWNEQNKPAKGATFEASTTIEVTEYWDPRWRCVYAMGEKVYAEPHDYGFVPFVYKLGPLGLPGFMNNPEGDADPLALPVNGMGSLHDQMNRASQGLSHFHFQKPTHDQKEAILSVVYTEIGKSPNPPTIVTQGAYSQDQGAPPLSSRKGARNILRDDETASVFATTPQPGATDLAMNAIGQDLTTGFAAPVDYGTSPESQSSAAAVQSLAELSRSRFASEMLTLEEYHSEVAEMWLRMLRDWGHLVGKDGERGQFVVPSPELRPGQPPVYTVTVEDLRRTGINVEVKLQHVPPSLLVQLGNAVRMWNEIGAMSIREGIELRGGRNPQAIMDEVTIEQALMSDLAKDVRLLDAVAATGNVDLYEVIRERVAQPPGGQPNGGPAGPPPPGGIPPGGSPMAGIEQAGSNPLLGIPGGPGRPPGSPNQPMAGPPPMPPIM